MKKQLHVSKWPVIFVSLCFILPDIQSIAQDSRLKELTEKFNRYQENAFQEKIFIHTSKDDFLAGEKLFLKVYLVDGMLHRPSNLSVVAFVEVVNNNDEPVVQSKVGIQDGKGHTSIDLPDTLTTANYRIIAYTSWMRNFDEDFFFAKEISIVNPGKRQIRHSSSINSNVIARFFPEGGNMVNGMTSKVAFQVTDNFGNGVDCRGFIVRNGQDTLVLFRPYINGIGNFILTPQKGSRYQAVISTSLGTISQDLPLAYDYGTVMSLVSKGEEINVEIQSNQSASFGSEFYLLIHNRQRVEKLFPARLDNSGRSSFSIREEILEDGISQIVLFDQNLKPLVTRLYFKQPMRQLKIGITMPKAAFGKRDSTRIDFVTENFRNIPVSANLSTSIYKVDNLHGYDSINILNYLFLTSDLKGRIENVNYYVTPGGPSKKVAIDNLMLTHGWSRLKWDEIAEGKLPVISFPPDHEGLTLKAKLVDDEKRPIANASVLIATPGNSSQLYAALGGLLDRGGNIQVHSQKGEDAWRGRS